MKRIVQFIFFLALLAATAQAQPNKELIKNFLQPISFTRTGVVSFFEETFNHTLYGTLALPASFAHLKDFIAHSKTMQHPLAYIHSITNIFHDRLKEAVWVNPYALSNLLTVYGEQHELFASACHDPEEVVKKILYQSLLSKFSDLKKDPELFMSTLSKEIVTQLHHDTATTQKETSRTITRFIEAALDKIIWDPREQLQCWNICKTIADQLATLQSAHIIASEEDLNHCYWSLVYRFCYFIETAGEHLSLTTYQAIKCDIATQATTLLTLPEREAFIRSKADYVQQVLFAAEVKVRARQEGLWRE